MNQHQHFDELCALAAIGELGEAERSELKKHIELCPDCRQAAREYYSASRMMVRFAARARASVIPASVFEDKLGKGNQGTPRWLQSRRLVLYVVPAIMAIAITLVFITAVHHSIQRGQLEIRTKMEIVPAHVSPRPQEQLSSQDTPLQHELLADRQQIDTLNGRVKAQQLTLDTLEREKAALELRLADLNIGNNNVHSEHGPNDTEVATLTQELEQARASEKTQRIDLLTTEAALGIERQKTSDLGAQLAAVKQVNAALGEVRDLIASRNLHVKDISREIDENGHPRRAFGRVFYAEGERLDFYAFDLQSLENSSKAFYVWQETREGKGITQLGRLRIDSVNEGRWLLSIRDPTLLGHLDSIFVTQEPDAKPVTRPTGTRILSAYLGNDANHP